MKKIWQLTPQQAVTTRRAVQSPEPEVERLSASGDRATSPLSLTDRDQLLASSDGGGRTISKQLYACKSASRSADNDNRQHGRNVMRLYTL